MAEAAVVTDYGDALLISKHQILGLNQDITKLAKEKVEVLHSIAQRSIAQRSVA